MPASGFYEWHSEGGVKQPYYISRTDGRPLLFAGLWERWESGEQQLESCTMITTEANGFMQQLHTRMPVIIEFEDRQLWLEEGPQELLRPAAEDVLQAWPVSRRSATSGMKGRTCSRLSAEQPGPAGAYSKNVSSIGSLMLTMSKVMVANSWPGAAQLIHLHVEHRQSSSTGSPT